MPRPSSQKQVINQITQNQQTKKDKVSSLFFQPNQQISSEVFQIVKSELKNISDKDHLYLVIKSTGGDAYSAVRIIRYIRTKFKNIVGIIPDYAYSAATLMMLGASNIFVSTEGYIAPIDKPMEHTPSGEPISALDVTQSLTSLASLVSEQARIFYSDLRGNKFEDYIPKKEALNVAWNSAIKLVEPLIAKIDPVLLQKSYRDLRIGMYYGIDLLKTGMLKNNFNKCYDVVSRLVNIYPSHGYAIFREEMKSLGLEVEDLEKCKDCEKLLEIYSKMSYGIKFHEDIYA